MLAKAGGLSGQVGLWQTEFRDVKIALEPHPETVVLSVLSVNSAGGTSDLDSSYGIIFGWIRSPVWFAACRQVCQHDGVAGVEMSTSTWKNGRSSQSCATAARRDLESVHAVGQENVQAELKGGLGHTGRSVTCIALVSPAASAVVLLAALCPVHLMQLGLLSALCCPGCFELQKYFKVILSLVL